MNFTTILMDADDTIFDFPKCEYGALKNSFSKLGIAFSDELYSTFSQINSSLWRELELGKIDRPTLRTERFRLTLMRSGNHYDTTTVTECADKYIHELSKQSILIKGAENSVRCLSRYCEINIITNGLSDVQRGRFAKSSITKYITKLYISDELHTQKPDKAFFDLVLQDIKEKNKKKILVVGDSLTSDMQGGKNAGLTTCLYDPEHKTRLPHPLCDHRINSLDDLIDLVSGGVK